MAGFLKWVANQLFSSAPSQQQAPAQSPTNRQRPQSKRSTAASASVYATMHPRELPQGFGNDLGHRGEKIVFDALTRLPREYDVFFQANLRPAGLIDPYERPLDFSVLHRQYGILAIEVKGGNNRLLTDGKVEQYWPRQQKWGAIRPETQVKLAAMKLINAYRELSGRQIFIPLTCCVVYPQTTKQDFSGGRRALPIGSYLQDDVPNLAPILDRYWSASISDKRPSLDWQSRGYDDLKQKLGIAVRTSPPAINGRQQGSSSRSGKPPTKRYLRAEPLRPGHILLIKNDHVL